MCGSNSSGGQFRPDRVSHPTNLTVSATLRTHQVHNIHQNQSMHGTPPWEHTLFLIYFPILSPVCLGESSFFCVLLSGICVPSNVERNKVDNKENKRVAPQKRTKKKH